MPFRIFAALTSKRDTWKRNNPYIIIYIYINIKYYIIFMFEIFAYGGSLSKIDMLLIPDV